MSKIIIRKNNSRIIRIFSGLAALLAVAVCSVKIVMAIQYNAITVSGTNGNITVNGSTIDGLKIAPAIVFNNTGDSITYQVVLSNPDRKAFQIKNISDDNTNAFITTTYNYDSEMNNADKPILITLAYTEYLPFGDELQLQDIHIVIDIAEESKSTENNPGQTNATTDNDPTILVPNTGSSNALKYLGNSSQTDQLLPAIIICIISVAILITVMPRKSRVRLGKLATVTLVIALGGISFSRVGATSSGLELTITGSEVTAMPDVSDPKDVVSVTFPNIYNNKVQDRSNQGPGNAIILKTMDDKYVLMDTGPSTPNVREVIYDTLAELQGREQVVLDYLIISHLDGDHYGNAVSFLNNENISIKNIVLKHEKNKDTVFKNIVQAAANNEANLITSSGSATAEYLASIGVENFNTVREGMVLEIGKYLKLNFFNTTDVYVDKECLTGYKLGWIASINSSSNYVKTANDEYIYIDGNEYATKQDGEFDLSSSKYPYADVTFHTTTTLAAKEGGAGMNRYFYAVNAGIRNNCESNPNSFGILAEVTTTNLKRYMYFTGDIENAGYGVLSNGSNSAAVYSKDYDTIIFENGEFQNNITTYAIPAEDNTAASIHDKLSTDANILGLPVETLLNNIVLYQESHHGGNNSERAVWKLNLNRNSGIYAIQEGPTDMATSTNLVMAKNYWYTLGALPAENKIRVGDNNKEGTGCTVNMVGETICTQY